MSSAPAPRNPPPAPPSGQTDLFAPAPPVEAASTARFDPQHGPAPGPPEPDPDPDPASTPGRHRLGRGAAEPTADPQRPTDVHPLPPARSDPTGPGVGTGRFRPGAARAAEGSASGAGRRPGADPGAAGSGGAEPGSGVAGSGDGPERGAQAAARPDPLPWEATPADRPAWDATTEIGRGPDRAGGSAGAPPAVDSPSGRARAVPPPPPSSGPPTDPLPLGPADTGARPARPPRSSPVHASSAGLPVVRPHPPAGPPGPPVAPPGRAGPQPAGRPPGAGHPPGPVPPPGCPDPSPPQPGPARRGSWEQRLGDHAPYGDGAVRRLLRLAAHLVTTTAATRELQELAAASQAPVTTGRRIAVISVRGGAGRSTVTALLGAVFAARRADHVLVADADPDHGSLSWRLGLPETDGLRALTPRLLALRGGIAELDTILARTPAGLRLLPGADGAPPGTTRYLTRKLSRFFAVCVTDCGRGLESPATADVLQDAHAAVLVAPATPDGVRGTRFGLGRMPPALRSRVVIALCTSDRGGRAALSLDAAHEGLAGTGAPIVTLPYDRHLAAATPIVARRLAEATTIEATRLAGYALRLAGQPTGGPR